MALYRHGDLLVESTAAIPPNSLPLRHLVLAEGELTGHAHRIRESEAATLYDPRGEGRGTRSHSRDLSGDLFLDVTGESATLMHEEHGPIELPRGQYRVWRQREYAPREIRTVRD